MTHRSLPVALATLLALAPFALVGAQQPSPAPAVDSTVTTGDVHGRVVNAVAQSPISGATIVVMIVGDTTSVAKTTTAPDGSFRVDGLRPARYRVRIRAIGYGPVALPPVVITAASSSIDAGTVALKTTTVELQEVVVNANRGQVQLTPDRNTYVMRDMPTTRGGNALDVLRNVPSVDVDVDNIVSLRGNSGVVVQINGRPSPMKAGQLGNFLAQLPADMVDKVEVIPNPSAKDDPEGVAGIINIVLRKKVDAATSGGLTVSGGTTGRAEIGGNLGYQGGPLSLYGSYGFLRDSRPRHDAIYRENLYTQPTTYLFENGTRTQIPLAHTFTGTAGYKLSDRDELSADLMYSTRTEAETNSIFYRQLDAGRAVSGLSDRLSRGTNHEFNLESTLGWNHAFAADGHELSSELRLFRASEGGPYRFNAGTFALDGTSQGDSAREIQKGYEHPDENALNVDYARPLASNLRLQTGYKGSLQTFHTTLDTRVFDATRSGYFPDTTRTSDFTYDQLVHAAYGMLVAQVGQFAMQAGLRAERATTQFHLNTRGATYDNRYNSLFPSALVAWNIDESRQVKLSYSTRIRRPDDTDQIDPTLHYQDPLNVSRGNPNLRPEYIRAFELGLQRTAEHMTVQVTPFYRHTIDAVRTIRTIDTLGVATRTFANVATTDAYGTDATVALSGGRVSGFTGASFFRQVSNAANLAPGLSARTLGWTARTNVTFRATPTLDVQTLLFYRAPMTVEQGRNSSSTRFSVAARQKLLGDQLGVTLRIIDPFSMSRERNTTSDPRFYQVTDRRRTIRGLLLSVNWNFGKSPKKRDRDEIDQGGGDTGGR